MGNLKKIQHGNQNQWGILCVALGKYELSFSIKRSTYFGGLTLKWWKCAATFPISEPYDKKECNCRKADQQYQRINFGSQLIKSSCKCIKVFGPQMNSKWKSSGVKIVWAVFQKLIAKMEIGIKVHMLTLLDTGGGGFGKVSLWNEKNIFWV